MDRYGENATLNQISIDTHAGVLTLDGSAIKGLQTVGEIARGVHGGNRLARNSLINCVVFSSNAEIILAEKI